MPASMPIRLALPLTLTAALAACDPPLTQLHPTVRVATADSGRAVLMEARYEPLWGVYAAAVRPAQADLDPLGPNEAVELVEKILGPEVCKGAPFVVSTEAPRVSVPSLGGWRMRAKCA